MLIHSYQESWIADFSALKTALAEALVTLPISIEHVGSTSVPGLAAKPIIDIDLIFDERVAFEQIKSRLAAVGYQHHGHQGIPGREVFKRSQPTNPHPVLDVIQHHLYGCPEESDEWQKHRLFRDYLLAHEGARVRYQRLKYEIAQKANQDCKRYALLKERQATTFINGVLEEARKERTQPAHGSQR